MKPPIWLEELHRQWFATRGKSLAARSRSYTRDWPKLLEEAGVRSAEDVATAGREGERLEKEGRLVLKRHRARRYLIERVELPLTSEEWLRGLFETAAAEDLQRKSLRILDEALGREHSLFPVVWTDWLTGLRTAFVAGQSRRPLSWREPDALKHLLDVTCALTSREWPSGKLVREASVEIGLGSKDLERSRRQIEACLHSMFGTPVSYALLGISGSLMDAEMAGDLCLHFPDGRVQHFDQLGSVYTLTGDLEEAVGATTSATRILMVENRKITLRRLASLNEDRSTLLAACAFPGPGLVRLLKLLPADLPVYHFGDTDPAGFLILSKLRQATGREVIPFRMKRRIAAAHMPLTEYDRRLLPGLLSDPHLADVRPDLEEILASGDKGDYEQETLGVPTLPGWPFYGD